MTDPSKPPRDTAYGARQKRQSTNLLYVLAILAVLIVIVFSGLHLFGQRFGVPV